MAYITCPIVFMLEIHQDKGGFRIYWFLAKPPSSVSPFSWFTSTSSCWHIYLGNLR